MLSCQPSPPEAGIHCRPGPDVHPPVCVGSGPVGATCRCRHFPWASFARPDGGGPLVPCIPGHLQWVSSPLCCLRVVSSAEMTPPSSAFTSSGKVSQSPWASQLLHHRTVLLGRCGPGCKDLSLCVLPLPTDADGPTANKQLRNAGPCTRPCPAEGPVHLSPTVVTPWKPQGLLAAQGQEAGWL